MPTSDPAILLALQKATPGWLKDGAGIRGNPVPSSSGSVGQSTQLSNWQSSPPTTSDPQQTDFGGSMKADSAPRNDPSSSGSSFPFWEWSTTQTGAYNAAGNPILAYDIWFGKPSNNSQTPSEVYSLSLFGKSSSGIIHTFTSHSTDIYGYNGGTGASYNSDGSWNVGNAGNNFKLAADSEGVSLNLADEEGSALLLTQDEMTLYKKDSEKYIKLSLPDIPEAANGEIYFREMELCDGKKILVLASAPY